MVNVIRYDDGKCYKLDYIWWWW